MRRLVNKIQKVQRKRMWEAKISSSKPLFWHVGSPNFGDDINPYYFESVLQCTVRLETDRSLPHILGAGSILNKATLQSVVMGSGLLEPLKKDLENTYHIYAVRGELSRAHVSTEKDVLLGDPISMINLVVNPKNIPKVRTIGYVPHVTEYLAAKKALGGRYHIIDPANDPMGVVADIASCDRIISQSLHGLIVADAMNVPNIWMKPSSKMTGGAFKFDDYFSTVDGNKVAVSDYSELDAIDKSTHFIVSEYKYSKVDYIKNLINFSMRHFD